MFALLFIAHRLSSLLFALLTCIFVAQGIPSTLQRKSTRMLTLAIAGSTFFAGILTLATGILFFHTYHWEFWQPRLVVAFSIWVGILYVLLLVLQRRSVPYPLIIKALLPVLAFEAVALSLETPTWLGTIMLMLYALAGSIAVYLYIVLRTARPRRRRIFRFGLIAIGLLIAAGLTYAQQQYSRLPGTMSMNSSTMAQNGTMSMTSVADYVGPQTATHVDRFNLLATSQKLTLSSGATINALTYGGTAPGPTLHVTQGDLVEVTLTNHLMVPTTIHWHGIDLPNAEDGVAGITQNAVLPGRSFTYRFIAKDAGTYWYHSHQDTLTQVGKGLYGMIIVEPRVSSPEHEESIALHTWPSSKGNRLSFNAYDTLDRHIVSPGTRVRLRIVNTDNSTHTIQLAGALFIVAAIDGRDIHNPSILNADRIELPTGGRIDLVFTMPNVPTQLMATDDTQDGALLLSSNGEGARLNPIVNAPVFDMTQYGTTVPGALTVRSHFDKSYILNIDQSFGFFDDNFGVMHTINGALLPHTSMLTVHEGDSVKLTFRNRTFAEHPMHIHGHHFTVLSHNGKSYSGSPLQLDSLLVKPGDTWEVAFIANNPGIWMSHCHNLEHASQGMDLMIAYDNVMTPYTFGATTHNKPE